MDRELLIEIGTEELPARWLPGLTTQFGARLEARLAEARVPSAVPIETFSTPRRLVARALRIPERQSDHEDLVMGPPVSAAVGADGQMTGAGLGFAKKQGVEPSVLERIETPKGVYLAHRKQLRGKATVDVLPDVLGATLRDLQYPKQLRWDALLEDGKGDLLSGRPIRWVLFLYGGRVVPFDITRTAGASSPLVQDIRAGAVTYGHRFLTTSGRAGRAIKVKGFDDYRRRLAENFVVVERGERHDRIARELDAEARRRGGRVSVSPAGQEALAEVPDLVEYPAVVSGGFPVEFLKLPEEVLTTTMIHHQHFFPLVDAHNTLMPAFLAVLNMEPEKPEIVSRNLERVLTARLRDARFFWDADRTQPLERHRDRLATVAFHAGLGSYRDKADRLEPLARWIAADVLGHAEAADHAALAARLCKADLGTNMVRELTELQGTMGGIYARVEGQPEAVWKAIYHHYLPVAVEPGAAPTRGDLGSAAITWAAVSLADKLDTLTAMFAAGERPTGSRDPFGLRRTAQGLVRLLVDLEELTGVKARPVFETLWRKTSEYLPKPPSPGAEAALQGFMLDRLRHLMTVRGCAFHETQATTWRDVSFEQVNARTLLDRARVFVEFSSSAEFELLTKAFKRIRGLLDDARGSLYDVQDANYAQRLSEPAELALCEAVRRLRADVSSSEGQYKHRETFARMASIAGPVEAFFDAGIRVLVDDGQLREARLDLLADLRACIADVVDPSYLSDRI